MTSVASPCTGVCAIEQPGGLCRGCKRTLDEIARWTSLSAAERGRIIASLTAR